MGRFFRKRASVLTLSLTVFLLDQLIKLIVVYKVPLSESHTAVIQILGDFLQIIHVRNEGALFSLGAHWPKILRIILFKILPVLVIAWLAVVISTTPEQQARIFHLKNIPHEEFTLAGRWAASLIVGGGFGNIVDRVFRPDGVVDFLDFKFYGLFGLDRWPTFNIADASIVLGMALLLYFSLFHNRKQTKKRKTHKKKVHKN